MRKVYGESKMEPYQCPECFLEDYRLVSSRDRFPKSAHPSNESQKAVARTVWLECEHCKCTWVESFRLNSKQA